MSTDAAAALVGIGCVLYTILIAALCIDLSTFATPEEVRFLRKYRKTSKESKRRIKTIIEHDYLTR